MMKRKLILLLTVCLICTGTTLAIDVPSGDFDNIDTDAGLDGANWIYVDNIDGGDWSMYKWGGTPWVANNYGNGYPSLGHSGSQWVDMNASYIYQALDATYVEGTTYEISAWATTDQEEQSLYMYFFEGLWVDWVDFQETGADVPAGDLSVWNQYTAEYTATAEDAGKQIGVGLWGEYDTYVDDVEFAIVPEPITLSLLGAGALMLRRRKR